MTRRRPGIGIVLLLAGVYGGYWIYRFTVSAFGPLAPLPLALLAAILLVAAAWWCWRRFRQEIDGAARHAAEWVWASLRDTPLVRAGQTKFPRASAFAARRVDPRAITGLGLSVGALVVLAMAWAFAEVSFEIVNGTSIDATDDRVVNLFALLRTPSLDRFMLAMTYIGSGRTVVVLATVCIIVALLWKRRDGALMIVSSLVASSIFFSTIKLLIGRPRPPLWSARIVQTGFSFPSGHATTAAAFYGVAAFLLLREWRLRRDRHIWLDVTTGICAIVLVALIGISRVYLGVHYPSDVLAGWAGGALCVALVFVITRIRQSRSHGAEPTRRPIERVVRRTLASVGALALGTTYLVLSYPPMPLPPYAQRPAPTLVTHEQVPALMLTTLPHYTVDLFGHRQEPINLVLVGAQSDVERSFRGAGWVPARQLTWTTFVQAARATLTHSADSAGPVTPSFLGEAPERLAFNQPVGRAFAKRHHIRIWNTQYAVPGGQRIWLATASYDEGFAIASGSFLPVHEIAPDIDTERDYVASSLEHAGGVARVQSLQIAPPELGTNSFGSPFFTYGKGYLLWLRDDGRPSGR